MAESDRGDMIHMAVLHKAAQRFVRRFLPQYRNDLIEFENVAIDMDDPPQIIGPTKAIGTIIARFRVTEPVSEDEYLPPYDPEEP